MFPLLTVTRSHKNKTHHSKALALAAELEAYKCYLSYRVFWGWVCRAQRTCGGTISCALLCSRKRCKELLQTQMQILGNGTIWSSVNEMCVAIAEESSIGTNDRIWGGRGGILWSEGHLCASRWTNLPSKPRGNSDFQNNRAYKKRHSASVSYAIQQDLEGNAARINGHYLMKTRHPWE